jgi:2-iminoacetate synthase
MPFGITTISAGSKTQPGGYADTDDPALEQFSVNDDRTPSEVEAAVRTKGLEPIWKDWSLCLQESLLPTK